MATESDLAFLSLVEAAAAVRRGEVTSLRLTEVALARLQRLQPTLNAFITVTADSALAEAAAADAARRRGERLPPLHGVPLGVKDLFDIAGVPTTAGSRTLAGHIPERDATAVGRLRQAGAVLIGKQNLLEFAYGEVHPDYGPAANPWNPAHGASGSSSGSAVAVAAGIGYGALGSDTGGSIRLPAAWCGIVGLKPTYGRVSRAGVVPLSWGLDHVGPMTRTAADCALLLAAIAGADPADAASASVPAPPGAIARPGDLRGVRVGVLVDPGALVDPEVVVACEEAGRSLAEAGAVLSEVAAPEPAAAATALLAIVYAEAAAYHEPWLRARPEDYAPATRARLDVGLRLPAVAYLQAQRARTTLQRAYDDLLGRFELLISPAAETPALPLAGGPAEASPPELDPLARAVRRQAAFNLTGLPAAAVPCGFSRAGLPVGLQIAGRAFAEEDVLRAAGIVQAAAPGADRRPPLD